MIAPKVAFCLYGVLIAFALFTLHGIPLGVALVIVLGLVAKSVVELIRRRMEP